jgi:catechol 2,3-dioxygenase-like lactoylglutathione lyase family enzyme
MPSPPRLAFLSLFVRDLDAARRRYESMLGVAAVEADPDPPGPHPFAARGPVVFDLGGAKLALYQANQQVTHPGDVGIGLHLDAPAGEMASRVAPAGGRVFFGPRPAPGDGREMAVFVMPDRHFFEVLGRGGASA